MAFPDDPQKVRVKVEVFGTCDRILAGSYILVMEVDMLYGIDRKEHADRIKVSNSLAKKWLFVEKLVSCIQS